MLNLNKYKDVRLPMIFVIPMLLVLAVTMHQLSAVANQYAKWRVTNSFQWPIVFREVVVNHEPVGSVILSPFAVEAEVPQEVRPIVSGQEWYGVASYYSHAGCVGCSTNQIMNNGRPFIEDAITVAFNRLPLGSYVLVTNLDNDETIIAEVADTGGFEGLGRIIDLSKGTKEALGCGDLCTVKVEEIVLE